MTAVGIAAAFLGVSSAQTLSPDEVRVTNHPYFPRPVVRVESQLVQLEVVVRDTRGRAVCGLTKDDFAVYDSGKRRDVSAFSVDASAGMAGNSQSQTSPAPQGGVPAASAGRNRPEGRWIALVLDDMNTPTGDLARAKIAAGRFIGEAAASGDRIAVFTTSGGETLDFTDNTAALLAAVASAESHPRSEAAGLAACPRITDYEAYEIVSGNANVLQAKVKEACRCVGAPACDQGDQNSGQIPFPPSLGGGRSGNVVAKVQVQAEQTWEQARKISQTTLEAIRASLGELRQTRPGRRILLLASSGFLTGTLEDELDAITDEAVSAGVVISSVDAKGMFTETPGRPINEPSEATELPTSNSTLQVHSLGDRLDSMDSAMARFAESTGGQLFRNNNDLDLGFHQIGLVPACVYLMGFPPAVDGKYHRIRVEMRRKNHEFLQARPGYFARRGSSAPQTVVSEALDAEVRGADERTELEATSSETPGAAATIGRQLTVRTHVNLQNVSFRTEKDRRVQRLTFTAVLFSPDGVWVTGEESVMDLTLKPESYERLLKSGISGMMTLEAAPGAYRLRIVVQEAVDGKMSATSKELRIPEA